jgi:hypothetical protein
MSAQLVSYRTLFMPLELSHGRAVVLIRQSAFERIGLTRESIDERYNLTDQEFRVEDGLIALGPLPSEDMLSGLIDDLENSGLTYFDDFFELSGNWPDWLTLYARGAKGRGT